MTEIPEHLLKRSRDRRAALGLGGGDDAAASGGDAPAATPATTAETAPAAAAPSGPVGRKAAAAAAPPPPPKPDPPYVAAAKSRQKIPFWAMLSLSLLPIWLFMYVRSVTEAPEVATGPVGVGAEVYSNCASCHGSAGEGTGSGRQFSDGEVEKTFPHIEDQLRFVYFGTANYNIEGVTIYGNPDREGGPHTAGSLGQMPGWGTNGGGDLTDDEILAVVCHERYTLGGADPESDEYVDEYEHWCSDESPIYEALESGNTSLATLADAGVNDAEGEPIEIMPIGDAPVEGSPPG